MKIVHVLMFGSRVTNKGSSLIVQRQEDDLSDRNPSSNQESHSWRRGRYFDEYRKPIALRIVLQQPVLTMPLVCIQ